MEGGCGCEGPYSATVDRAREAWNNRSSITRTGREIVEQTNDIARLALDFIGTGYVAPPDHQFWAADDPRSQKAWNFARKVQELMTATDADDAVTEMVDDTCQALENHPLYGTF